jgi:RNA ligase (TIGR02306 family)
MSNHEIKVIKIKELNPHPDASRLLLTTVWGYECVVAKDQFKIGDLAAFIIPDSVVDVTRPEFAFLAKEDKPDKTKKRITVTKLRGIYSSGLLIPAPIGSKEGDDVADILGITHWEPVETKILQGGAGNLGAAISEKGPDIEVPHYDLENIKRYSKVIQPGEEVLVTGKVHGSQIKALYHNNRMYCGSKNQWKRKPGNYLVQPKTRFFKLLQFVLLFVFKNDVNKLYDFLSKYSFLKKYKYRLVQSSGPNAWWLALEQNPWVETWCKNNPNVILYGEIAGSSIQGSNFNYGYEKDKIGISIFDIFENGKWIPNKEFYTNERFKDLKFVDLLYQGPFDLSIISEIAEQKETFNGANHIREGVVIKLESERIDPSIGRVVLKLISNNYLFKNKI